MKRLLWLLLVAFAGWYGWKHYPQVLERQPSHEAVIENDCDTPLERVRLVVDGQTFVKESIAPGEQARFPFRVARDASFRLTWQQGPRERTWTGGMVPKGPMVQRHRMRVDDEGEVMYFAENKAD